MASGRTVSQVSSVVHIPCKQGVTGSSPALCILFPPYFTFFVTPGAINLDRIKKS